MAWWSDFKTTQFPKGPCLQVPVEWDKVRTARHVILAKKEAKLLRCGDTGPFASDITALISWAKGLDSRETQRPNDTRSATKLRSIRVCVTSLLDFPAVQLYRRIW